jgi:hypothetical protein
MSIKLPFSDKSDSAGFSFSIPLDGDVFKLEFRYNDRDERYYLNVYDEDDALLAASVKVVKGHPLLKHVVDERRPWGDFSVIDVGANAEPTLGNLGNGIEIIFSTYAEVIANG